jgi:hypothetical protein
LTTTASVGNCYQDRGQVAIQHAFDVEAKSRELLALYQAIGVRLDEDVLTVLQAEPVNRFVEHTPGNVLGDAVAPVRFLLRVQVVRGTAGRYFDDELRRPFNKALGIHEWPAVRWSPEHGIRLDLDAAVE